MAGGLGRRTIGKGWTRDFGSGFPRLRKDGFSTAFPKARNPNGRAPVGRRSGIVGFPLFLGRIAGPRPPIRP